MLGKRDLDVVISKLPFNNPMESFEIRPLSDLPNSFYASTNLLKRYNLQTTITKQQLCQLPIITSKTTSPDTKTLREHLGQNIESIIEVDANNEFLYSMIKRDVGIAYINSCCVDPRDSVQRVTVTGISLPKFTLGVIYNRDESSKIVHTFLELLTQSICR